MAVKAGAPRPADGRMPLVEHLREFRNRAGWSMLALTVAVVVCFVLWEPILDFLRQPYLRTEAGRSNDQLFAFGPFEEFAVRLRTAFIAGAVFSSPVWLYHLGAFITPALHRHERRYAAGFLGASLLLFGVGVTMAYLTLDKGLNFLLTVGGDDLTNLLGVKDYLNFVTLTLLAFGFAFLFPVVVAFLNLVGVFPAARMRSWRRGMVVAIFAAAAVLTPSQDPFTFVIMAVPLYGLYEVCILGARLRERRARRKAAAHPDAQLADDEASQVDLTPSRLDV